MKKISAYIWQFRGKYLIAVSALFAAVTLDMLSPRLTKMVVDDVIVGGDIQIFKWILLGFFCSPAVSKRISDMADRIFVIDNGGICEQGTAAELMERKGAYYKLYMAQFAGV